MNLNAVNLTINPCTVCGYLFSDEHHIWPQAKGGKQLPTINLCPNHHRYANIVQAMLFQKRPRNEVELFAHEHFDHIFNHTILDFLIDEQDRISWKGWSHFYADQVLRAVEVRDRSSAMLATLQLFLALIGDDPIAATQESPERRSQILESVYLALAFPWPAPLPIEVESVLTRFREIGEQAKREATV